MEGGSRRPVNHAPSPACARRRAPETRRRSALPSRPSLPPSRAPVPVPEARGRRTARCRLGLRDEAAVGRRNAVRRGRESLAPRGLANNARRESCRSEIATIVLCAVACEFITGLRAGKRLVGTIVGLPGAEIAEIMAGPASAGCSSMQSTGPSIRSPRSACRRRRAAVGASCEFRPETKGG